jgi:hypothetical protein
MRIKNTTTPVCEMQAQLRFKGCPGTLITSLRKRSRQVDLASFSARSEGVNGSPDKKKSALDAL